MVLHPLEFTDCLLDSPHFRENLLAHEKELERTSQAIKVLIREVEDLFGAAKNLSKAQRSFSDQLKKFKFDCIGTTQTEDEQCISESLEKMGNLIADIEDERDRMLEKANDQFIQPLINFRKKDIGDAKEGKRKFDRQTTKFCTQLEKYCSLTTKKNDATLQEADAVLDMERRAFYSASMDYVLLLQKVQEKKKFEFVETLLRFMYAWLTFYHQGHEVAQDFKPYMHDLQHRLQLTRDNFDINFESAEKLRNKMLEVRNSSGNSAKSTLSLNSSRTEEYLLPDGANRACTKQGYVFLMDKKPWGTTWTKYYCLYQKENRVMTMIPYQQGQTRGITTETFVVTSCTRRPGDSIEKRWCFDVTAQDKPSALTFQALGKEDRQQWLDALDGKEPIYASPSPATPLALNHSGVTQAESPFVLNDKGVHFVEKIIEGIESRGLDDQQGLYRLVGVASKVNRLLQTWFSSSTPGSEDLSSSGEWDVKSLTSALKKFFGNLPEPLLTYKLHSHFIDAVKTPENNKAMRVQALTSLVRQLPEVNRVVLDKLMAHLARIASFSDTNLMTVANLGVCFGPTLMRSEEETMAAIMEIKFCNIVVELLVEYYDTIFVASREPDSGRPSTQTTPQYVNTHSHLYQYEQNHQPPSLMDTQTPLRKDKRPAPAPPRGPVAQYMNRTPPSPPAPHPSMASFVLSHSNSSDRSSPLDDTNVTDGGGNSSDYDNAPSSRVMSSSMNAGFGPGVSKAAPRTIWDAHFSRSEGANINSAGSGGPSGQNHYYSSVPLKESRNAGSPALTSSSESLGAGSGSGPVGATSTNLVSNPLVERRNGGNEFDPAAGKKASRVSLGVGGGDTKVPRNQVANTAAMFENNAIDSTGDTARVAPPPWRPNPTKSQRVGMGGVGSGSVESGDGDSQIRDFFPPTGNRKSSGSVTVTTATPSTAPPPNASASAAGRGRRVRTIYACQADHGSELSFEANQIIVNVRHSQEPGWLEGTLNGKVGLIPANYVEYLPDASGASNS